jgi:hypothetical protein
MQFFFKGLEQIFSDISNKYVAMINFGDLNGHLLPDSHTCTSDYYKTLLVEFETLFGEKMNSGKEMRKHQSNEKSPHYVGNNSCKTFKKV